MAKGPPGKADRLGDDTRARIDDLKGGWKLPTEDRAPATPSTPPPAPKSKRSGPTRPPPPPGSPRRADSDDPTLTEDALSARAPLPKPARADSEAPTIAEEPSGLFDQKDAVPPRISEAPSGPSRLFTRADSEAPTIADERPRPPASPQALPSLPRAGKPTRPPPLPPTGKSEPPKTPPLAAHKPPELSMPSALDAAKPRPKKHQEASRLADFDPPVQAAVPVATGKIRLAEAVPRSGGPHGDLSYLVRATLKRRRAERELAGVRDRLDNEREARSSRLMELARHAIGDDDFDQTFVGRARQSLLEIEEKRSRHAGRVAAADERLAAIEANHTQRETERHETLASKRAELASIAERLVPLQKEVAAVRKKAAALHEQMDELSQSVRRRESSLSKAEDKSAVYAEIASLQAERESLGGEEPQLQAQLNEIEPQIATLIARREVLNKEISGLQREEDASVIRTSEKLDALRAGRAVESRAVDDRSSERQDQLLELGEALRVEVGDDGTGRAKAIARHEREIAELEGRIVELQDLIDSIERGPILRAYIYIALVILGAGAAAFFVLRG